MVDPLREDIPSPQVRKFLEQHENYVVAMRRRNFLTKLAVSLFLAYLGACIVDKGVYRNLWGLWGLGSLGSGITFITILARGEKGAS